METVRKISRVIILFGGLFCIATGAWLWTITRPEPAVFVFSVGDGGRDLFVATGAISAMQDDELAKLPLAMRYFSRWHLPGRGGAIVSSGKPVREVRAKLDIDAALKVSPVRAGKDNLIVAASESGTISLVRAADGKVLRDWQLRGLEPRALAVSRDGRHVAWSFVSLGAIVPDKGVTRSGGNPFRLFIADTQLRRVREIFVSEYYPYLVPGSLDWGADGALYFCGFDRENHRKRVELKVSPAAMMVEPAGAARAALASASPDGGQVASVGLGGLLITDVASGMGRTIVSGYPVTDRMKKPAWSRDGKMVAFVRDPVKVSEKGMHYPDKPSYKPRIVVVSAAAAKVVAKSPELPGFTCEACEPVWSPGGGAVFVSGWKYVARPQGIYVKKRASAVFDIKAGRASFLKTAEDAAKYWK